jgi:hypothetical protein
MNTNALARRLDRLERTPTGSDGLFVIPIYVGMTQDEGLTMVFGEHRPPAGAQMIFVYNALPTDRDVPYHWWTDIDRENEAFATAYVSCRSKAREVNTRLAHNQCRR